MTTPDQPNEPVAPQGARPDVVRAEPLRPVRPVPAPRARGGGVVALALLLSLVALAACGYLGWQAWQQQQGRRVDSQDLAGLQQRVATLETTLATVADQRGSLTQRIDDAAQVNRSLREELLGQAARTRQLEDAVAKLARSSLSGHDAMLLDETQSLLRMASERYTLFHDAQGAAAAYVLADQTLAAVNDAAFIDLRQTINAERAALEKSQPQTQAHALQQLAALRGSIAALPLKPLDAPDAAATDAWSRIRRALAGVISVQRDNGAPLAVADARFARELAMLDLAQAQAALLAHDADAYAGALARVDAALASQFDPAAASVRQARADIAALAAALPATAPVQLGAAQEELRNLRAVQAMQPQPDAAAPAPAASAATPAGGATP